MSDKTISIQTIEQDYETKLFPIENLTIEIVYKALLKFLEESYDKTYVDFYDEGDEDFINDIFILENLDKKYTDKYLKIVKEIDDSYEDIISRYCEIIGLNKLMNFDCDILKFDEERIRVIASGYSDTPYKYINATYDILKQDEYYENIINPLGKTLSLEDKKKRFFIEKGNLEDELGVPNYYLEDIPKIIH